MLGRTWTYTVHLHGTLAANAQGAFQVPCAMDLIEVSAVASNDSDATLQIGTSADADGVLTATAIGDEDTPVIFDADDFDGALCDQVAPYHAADNTIIEWVLDYDGAAGTAGQNVALVFTFIH